MNGPNGSPWSSSRPARSRFLGDTLRAASALGVRAVLASFVLASAWTAVTLGHLLRRRAAVG